VAHGLQDIGNYFLTVGIPKLFRDGAGDGTRTGDVQLGKSTVDLACQIKFWLLHLRDHAE
jgi:hypothetical protein